MVQDVGLSRACSVVVIFAAVGTKAFVCSPLRPLVTPAHLCCSIWAYSRHSSMERRHRAKPAAWSPSYCSRLLRSPLLAGQQSVDGGVQLPPPESVDEYASFLAEAIRTHLDEDWMEQACHGDIGNEVAKLFRAAVKEGTADLTTLVLDIGSNLEKMDMGDAFVGPWDIANLASDFLMGKMGAEVSGCSTKVPSSPSAAGDTSTSWSTFRLTQAGVSRVQANLASDFSRYRFLKDFMNEDLDWEDVNIVMAVYQGYLPEDSVAAKDEGVRHVWRKMFPGPMPPDLRTAEGVVETLEIDYPDLPDLTEGLQVVVETVYGGEATKIDSGNPDIGVPANNGFLLRSTICKWFYMMGFLNDEIKRAPDDLETISDLVSGRIKLKSS